MYHLSSAVLVSTYVVCSTYVLLVVLMFLTLTQVFRNSALEGIEEVEGGNLSQGGSTEVRSPSS